LAAALVLALVVARSCGDGAPSLVPSGPRTPDGRAIDDAGGRTNDIADRDSSSGSAGSNGQGQESGDAETDVEHGDEPPKWTLPEVAPAERTVVTSERIGNREATVPPQCYTKTQGRFNPCYTCHQTYDRQAEDRLNELDDGSIQGGYSFSDVGVTNHWRNLFVDRSSWLASIDDAEISAYVDDDNYSALAGRLRDRDWKGFIPDLARYEEAASAFGEHGLAKDGSYWVAFNYKPFLGTFWPTNGATDDVLIRLPKAFRERGGRFDASVYFVNLTLVELNIKQLGRASIWAVDEAALGADVNGDGDTSVVTEVVRSEHYVGDASDVAVSFQQFPTGTELMHSVRYVGVRDDGAIFAPKRMKELRYMRKVNALPRTTIVARYANERKEKLDGALPHFVDRGDEGFDNGLGWFVQGFIEDYDGELRPQSYEEGLFCMGCHTAVGTTIDSTFSFARKVTGDAGWGYIDLRGMPDAPNANEPGGEIRTYLARAGGGSEFRENAEMRERWFNEDGTVDDDAVTAADLYALITPSRRRALDMNKAYTHIVRHQSFIFGRDATWRPAQNVYHEVDEDTPPLEAQYRYFGWDLRLDWSQRVP
jgi:hypothetical protein